MARLSNLVKSRQPIPFRLLAMITAIFSLIALCLLPAYAYAAPHPTLTVHATISPSQSPATGMGSLLPNGAYSAGPGFVFELDKLDPAKVRDAVPEGSTSEQRTEAILAHPENFVDGSAAPVYGITDANGTVTNKDAVGDGSWISGATYDSSSHTLTGGEPAVFHGTTEAPEYYIVRLIYAPRKGVTFESGVVQLPYEGKDGWIWDLVIYPKVCIPSCPVNPPQPVTPTNPNKPPVNPHNPIPSTPKTPPHNVVNPPHPGSQSGVPGQLSNTGTNILLILLAVVTLMLIGLFVSDLRRRHEQKQAETETQFSSVTRDMRNHSLNTMNMNEIKGRSER